ncbi:enoyl-CoA-hydratase DpgB [Streptomyces coeruleoprunus]|uniref:Enoyl-CoA-hydratase DpgB n=1 Tax=Streptomyces coeruleoprunus TaxID=285563 RepID=A0ABV9X8D3_9ACTN
MATPPPAEELADGLGLQLRIDGALPLAALTRAVDDLCRRADARDRQTVVVLRLGDSATGSWPGDVGIQDVNRWERAVRRLERLTAVTVAVAGGTCGGPALDLLLATDYRMATADLRLVLPVNDGHFWPGMAVHRLVRQTGLGPARRLVLWGHDVTARRALECGLIDEIGADAEEAVRTATVWLGRASATELAVRRALLLEAAAASHEDALGTHLAACDRELRRLRGPGQGGTPAAGPGPPSGSTDR